MVLHSSAHILSILWKVTIQNIHSKPLSLIQSTVDCVLWMKKILRVVKIHACVRNWIFHKLFAWPACVGKACACIPQGNKLILKKAPSFFCLFALTVKKYVMYKKPILHIIIFMRCTCLFFYIYIKEKDGRKYHQLVHLWHIFLPLFS